jgi:hypothetical protein
VSERSCTQSSEHELLRDARGSAPWLVLRRWVTHAGTQFPHKKMSAYV